MKNKEKDFIVELSTLYGEDQLGNLHIIKADGKFRIKANEQESKRGFFSMDPTPFISKTYLDFEGTIERVDTLPQKGNFLNEAVIEKMEAQIKELQMSVNHVREEG